MNPLPPYQSAPTDNDPLPVVNERDEPVGVMPRRQVHLENRRHRAVHVGIFDSNGRIWLQQRARTKDSWPGAWDLSATGHVDPGETYDQAAVRELAEELAIDARPAFVTKFDATEGPAGVSSPLTRSVTRPSRTSPGRDRAHEAVPRRPIEQILAAATPRVVFYRRSIARALENWSGPCPAPARRPSRRRIADRERPAAVPHELARGVRTPRMLLLMPHWPRDPCLPLLRPGTVGSARSRPVGGTGTGSCGAGPATSGRFREFLLLAVNLRACCRAFSCCVHRRAAARPGWDRRPARRVRPRAVADGYRFVRLRAGALWSPTPAISREVAYWAALHGAFLYMLLRRGMTAGEMRKLATMLMIFGIVVIVIAIFQFRQLFGGAIFKFMYRFPDERNLYGSLIATTPPPRRTR